MTGYPFSYLPDELDGKRVLITGGTKGVGAATVQRFKMSGALVATTARSESSESQSSLIFIRRISAPPPVYERSSTALSASGVESTSWRTMSAEHRPSPAGLRYSPIKIGGPS